MIRRENEKSRIRAAHMDNLRSMLGIRRMDRVSAEYTIRELYRATKEVDEKIEESVLQRFGHNERMRNDKIAERMYVGECEGSRLVGRQRKR